MGIALALIVAPQWLDVQDDGLYMYQANIILHGGVPYRDFLLHDAPLGNAWHALMLLLFGNDALVLRLAVVPFKASMVPAIYALSRPLVPRLPALLAALIVPIIDNNSYYTVAHVALNALALGLAALLLLARWNRDSNLALLVWTGVVLGIIAGFKQNMGLYLLAGAALWLLDPDAPLSEEKQASRAEARIIGVIRAVTWFAALGAVVWLVRATPDRGVLFTLVVPVLVLALAAQRPMRHRAGALRLLVWRWAALGGGFLLAVLPWLAWVVAGAGLSTVIDGLVVVPSRLAKVWFAPLRPPADELWWLLALYAGGIILACGLLIMCRVEGISRQRASILCGGAVGLWAGALLLLSPLPHISTTGLIYLWLYFNIPAFWLGFLMVERLPWGNRRTHARLLLISATFLSLEMYPQLRRINSNWCFALFLPLVAWVLWKAWLRITSFAPSELRRTVAWAPALALALLPILATVWTFDWRIGQFISIPESAASGKLTWLRWVPLDLPHFSLLESQENYDYYHTVARAIETRTQPGEPIYCAYRQIAFYMATGRPAAVRDVYAPPGTTAEDAGVIVGELRGAGVKVILADNTLFDPRGPRDSLFPQQRADWAAPLLTYVTLNFHKVQDLGKWSLWEKK